VAAWPAALLVWLLVLPVALAVLALLLVGFPAGLMETGLRLATHMLLADGRPVVIATAILLLAWPVLAYPWERLWSSAPRPSRHQPWWPYLAAASVTDLQAGNSTAANNAMINAADQAIQADTLLTQLDEQCIPS
jgi:hypothetical protein